MTAGPLSPHSISEAQRALLLLVRRVGFGTITGICVERGQLSASSPMRARREVKLGSDDPATQRPLEPLHREDIDLLAELLRLPDGTGVVLRVRHGLPFVAEYDLPGAET